MKAYVTAERVGEEMEISEGWRAVAMAVIEDELGLKWAYVLLTEDDANSVPEPPPPPGPEREVERGWPARRTSRPKESE